MAINLSDLTGASTSANILAEVQSTADFLDSVPVLKNLADPSGATDAKQFTATNQPTALPLIDGKGYLYCSGISGNYASATGGLMPVGSPWTMEISFIVAALGVEQALFNVGSNANGISIRANGVFSIVFGGFSAPINRWITTFGVTAGVEYVLRLEWDGVDTMTAYSSDVLVGSQVFSGPVAPVNSNVFIGRTYSEGSYFTGSIKSLSMSGLAIDFTSPNVRHGATAFECATGQVVTINQSGNNPATLIRIPSLRFDGVDDWYSGLFDSAIAGGRLFAAFTVLGDGGDSTGRVFCAGTAVGTEFATDGAIWLANSEGASRSYFEGVTRMFRAGGFTGTHIHEVLLSGSAHKYLLDGGGELTDTTALTIAPTRFSIGATITGGYARAAIDLHELILTPPDITESAATTLRNYINNRLGVY